MAKICNVSEHIVYKYCRELNINTKSNRVIYVCGELSQKYYHGAMVGALRRNLIFNVTSEYVWQLFLSQNKKCALSGVDIVLDRKKSPSGKQTASLDRIDSSKGYLKDNVQWVHKSINIMKMDMEQDEFLDWCGLVTQYQ